MSDTMKFFDFDDFEWRFDPAPKGFHLGLGVHFGEAEGVSSDPRFSPMTASIRLLPFTYANDGRIGFQVSAHWTLDEGNTGSCPMVVPRGARTEYPQPDCVDLPVAKLAAYNALKKDYESRQFHLMP